MWLQTSSQLSLPLNFLGAFLPRRLHSLWASGFQAWGFGKSGWRDPSWSPREPQVFRMGSDDPHTSHTGLHRPYIAATLQILASLHMPQPHSSIKASSPRWVLQKHVPFQCPAGLLLFQMLGRHNERIQPSQKKNQVIRTTGTVVEMARDRMRSGPRTFQHG